MELGIHDIIKKAVLTPKSVQLYTKLGQITFEVHVSANKPMIADAIEKIWNVKVENVRVSRNAGKNKMAGRRPFKGSDKKKAIVTLKKGYKIDLPGQFEQVGSPVAASE